MAKAPEAAKAVEPPNSWMALRDDFRSDFSRSPEARLFHCIHLRKGIPIDEPDTEWRPLLKYFVLSTARPFWHNTYPRAGARFGVMHVFVGQRRVTVIGNRHAIFFKSRETLRLHMITGA